MISKNHSKFPPGQILATPGALEKARQTSAESFSSGSPRGDWGDVYEEDRQANDQAFSQRALDFSDDVALKESAST